MKSFVFLFLFALNSWLGAQSISDGLAGDWSLDVESGEPGWMSIQEEDGELVVYFRLYVGSFGPYREVEVVDGKLGFDLKKKKKKNALSQRVEVGVTDGNLDGLISRVLADGTTEVTGFTGRKIAPMPAEAPDLSTVRFGHPIALFNGKDMTGWTPHEREKINGWSVEDGMLVNTTPKTDFSATGDYANLKTEAVFEDFWLHVEFLIGEQRNSGVYLRGMYEAQVVDRDSRMQGLQGVGAIFSLIEPSERGANGRLMTSRWWIGM